MGFLGLLIVALIIAALVYCFLNKEKVMEMINKQSGGAVGGEPSSRTAKPIEGKRSEFKPNAAEEPESRHMSPHMQLRSQRLK